MNWLYSNGSTGGRLALASIGFTISFTTLCTIVFLGIFGLVDPEADAWYGKLDVKDDDQGGPTLFSSRELAMEANATDIVDIHSRFVNWNLWGFIMILSTLPIAIIIIISHAINVTCGKVVTGISTCACGCSMLAWWIMGIVWRFRADGMYASGDIVPKGTSVEDW